MAELVAFPVPVDADTAVWAGPLFVAMALAGFVVLVWQAVRYFRDERSDERSDDRSADRSADRDIDGDDPHESPAKPRS